MQLPKVDKFHAVSNAIKHETALYGADIQKIQVIYSGLRLSEFKFIPRVKKTSNIVRIISVGRAHWKKNYSSAILAIKKLKEQQIFVHYTIIGGACEELYFMVNELGLNNSIKLLSNLSFEEVRNYLNEVELFVLPSVEEGIANAALEAMALGIPVITTDCGGMSEVVNNQNGWLVPLRDEHAIADAILNYLQCSEETLIKKITAARHTIEQQHSEQKMINDMVALYQGVLKS
jgi:glycosyltransferase involved in cell wall biosynthesis